MPAPARWHLYVMETRDGRLYTGISTDPERRRLEHERGVRGAKALRAQGPLRLAYRVEVGERGAALRLEYAVKKLPRAAKLALLSANPALPALRETLGLND